MDQGFRVQIVWLKIGSFYTASLSASIVCRVKSFFFWLIALFQMVSLFFFSLNGKKICRSMARKYSLKLPDVLTNRKSGSPENDALAFLQIKHVCKLEVVQIQKVIRIKLMLKVAVRYW